MKNLIIATICIGININNAHAEFQFIGESEGLLIGVATGAEYSIYRQTNQPMINVMPYIAYEWDNLHIGIDDLAYEFFDDRTLTLTTSIEPRWSFTNIDDSVIFEDIKRDDTFELGFMANYQLQKGLVSTWYIEGKLLQGVSGGHDGQEMAITLGFNREYAELELDIAVGAIYRSEKLSEYLYGVTHNEAIIKKISAFDPKASTTPFIEFNLQQQLWKSSLLVINASSELYSTDIQKSPLLGRGLQVDLLMGIVMQF